MSTNGMCVFARQSVAGIKMFAIFLFTMPAPIFQHIRAPKEPKRRGQNCC